MAHNILSSTSLASLLSRLTNLNKARNHLMDILRLAARTSTHRDNNIVSFSHFPAPKRPVNLPAKTRGEVGTSIPSTVMSGAEVSSKIVDTNVGEGKRRPASASASSSRQTKEAHHLKSKQNKSFGSQISYFGYNPAQIRASARKTIETVTGLNESKRDKDRDRYADWSEQGGDGGAESSAVIAERRITGTFVSRRASRLSTLSMSPSPAGKGLSRPSSASTAGGRLTNLSVKRVSHFEGGGGGALAPSKYDKIHEEAVLRHWVAEWAISLPWKVGDDKCLYDCTQCSRQIVVTVYSGG